MTDTKNHRIDVPAGSLQGRRLTPRSLTELNEAIELAFDYRGDVTIELKKGGAITGYLFNREGKGADAWIDLFPADGSGTRRIRYDDIATVVFSGEDTASGKSWEHWAAKKESERKAEAARVAADVQARGYL